MFVISVMGRKGGTGKTLISHLLAYGFGMDGYPSLLAQTDVRTNVPQRVIRGKPYMNFGVRGTPEEAGAMLAHCMDLATRIPSAVLVMDGGANRRNVDFLMAEYSQLILIPVSPGYEDMEVAMQDHEEITSYLANLKRDNPNPVAVAFVLNRWPGDKRRRDAINLKPWVENYLEQIKDKRLATVVPDLASVIDVGYDVAPSSPLAVRRVARALTSEIAKLVGLEAPPNIPVTIEEPDDESVEGNEALDVAEEKNTKGRKKPKGKAA